jgi:oligopeptide/dipeptide ABC transporter ATP-binding protein
MVYQEPMTSHTPLLTIGSQIEEPLRLHRRLPAAAARGEALALLARVQLDDPERCARAYPHQLSGGMRQRVMIAMALACAPDLLIADEPTTALDVTVQAQILALLRAVQAECRFGLLFITHDLAVVSQVAEQVCVMYAGRIVERGPTAAVLGSPQHPYTRGLLRSTLCLDGARRGGELPVIPGDVPAPGARPRGCAFAPRCSWKEEDERCAQVDPRLRGVAGGVECACWRTGGRASADPG